MFHGVFVKWKFTEHFNELKQRVDITYQYMVIKVKEYCGN